jgi:hypothetical protein
MYYFKMNYALNNISQYEKHVKCHVFVIFNAK